MKRKLSILLLLIVLVSALIACVACKNKTEPVYQGMTIARQSNANALVDSASQLYANNGNGIGWGWGNEGKAPDNGEFVPADNDSEVDKDVEDIVTIEVSGDDTVKYYVKSNETFIVQVHISNPDDYEIQSFTLNGQKYANYMFRQGSTMELLLLEVQAPATSGYLDLTIDAIKYIDGTEIKDVRMDGSKTIKAGVAYEHEPTATVTSQTVDTTKATFTFNVTDSQDLIGNNAITAYLTDGDKKLAEKQLKLGSNTVTWDNLTMGTTYQYGIATSYDLIDGYGVKAHWLLSDKFTTLKTFAITNGVATQDSVTFNIEKTGIVGNVTDVKLYDCDTSDLVATLNGTVSYSYSNLLSNHSYLIEANFTYEINGKTVNDSTKTLFTTLAKTAPTVNVTNTTSTQTSIGFDVATTDVDNILTINKIELYRGETLVKTAASVDVREFADLLSNNEYTVKVTYSYDLNDGDGVHTQTATASKKTVAKTAPTVNVTNTTSAQTTLGFDLATTDVDSILTVDKIELYLGETLVKTATSADVREFADLLSNNEYTIKVTYSYELNDGNGVHTQTATANKKTVAKTAPTVAIENTTSTQATLGFDLATTDVDGILNITAVELYNGETVAKTLDKTLTTFNVGELTTGTMYTIKITYTYDLNDGEGVHTEYATTNYPTLVESVAVTEVSLVNTNQVRLGEELNLRVYFDNPNNVQLTNIYVNGVKVQVSGGDRKTYAIVRFATTESGLIDFYVDRVDYNFVGVEISQQIDSLAHVTFPVYTDLDVKCEGVSASPYEYTGYGIYFYFDNPQNYKVYKVNGSTDFMQISDHEFYVSCLNLNDFNHNLSSIEYGYDDYGTTTQALTYRPTQYTIGNFKPVYTTEDFINMSGSDYYILMNDLDMRNVNITNQIKLRGYLNGNGHTIRGLHNVIDTSSQNYFDLFVEMDTPESCSIFNVNFTELYISIVNNKADRVALSLFGQVRLYNCTVSGDLNASGNIGLAGTWVNGQWTQDLIGVYDESNTFNLNTTINGDDISDTTTKVGIKNESSDALEITDDGVIYYHCGDNATVLLGCYNKDIAQLTIRDDTIIICDNAFKGCANITELVIPDSVTTVGSGAFSGCSGLKSVVMGNSVTSIDRSSFWACAGLKTIHYTGTAEDWAKISIGDNNKYLTDTIRYYYSESEPELNSDGTAYDGNYWYYNDNHEIVVWTYNKEN